MIDSHVSDYYQPLRGLGVGREACLFIHDHPFSGAAAGLGRRAQYDARLIASEANAKDL
jgi:hypothetical protein